MSELADGRDDQRDLEALERAVHDVLARARKFLNREHTDREHAAEQRGPLQLSRRPRGLVVGRLTGSRREHPLPRIPARLAGANEDRGATRVGRRRASGSENRDVQPRSLRDTPTMAPGEALGARTT